MAAHQIPELLKGQTALLLQRRESTGLLHWVENIALLTRHALDQRRFDLLEWQLSELRRGPRVDHHFVFAPC